MTHDYKRHGTTTLFAALNAHDGTVIAHRKTRHRHEEWLAFLRQIDRETPKDKVLHLICDNYATHKHPRVKAWLKKHARFHMHFTPTSGSWLNMVERFFRSITVDRCAVESSRVSLSLPKQSRVISPLTTRTPSPLFGLRRPMTFCRKSCVGGLR